MAIDKSRRSAYNLRVTSRRAVGGLFAVVFGAAGLCRFACAESLVVPGVAASCCAGDAAPAGRSRPSPRRAPCCERGVVDVQVLPPALIARPAFHGAFVALVAVRTFVLPEPVRLFSYGGSRAPPGVGLIGPARDPRSPRPPPSLAA